MSTTNASDDEMEWEEVVGENSLQPGDVVVEIPDHLVDPPTAAKSGTKGKGSGRKLDEAEKARLNTERLARLNSHRIHTVALLANAAARLISLTPLTLQNHFDMITKKHQPDKGLRGRQFEAAVNRLTQWWTQQFKVVEGDYMNIKSRTFTEVQQELRERGLISNDGTAANTSPNNIDKKGKGKAKAIPIDDYDLEEGEPIHSSKSLMKHALTMRGSRDTSAQLFTALCRALGVPARLVVSLQSVPWKSSVGKKAPPKSKLIDPKGKGKEPAVVSSSASDDSSEMEVVVTAYDQDVSGSGKGKAIARPAKTKPVVHLRKTRPSGRRLGVSSSAPPPGGWPPVFWTEVFSRPDGIWIPVDPIRNIVNKKRMFEPPSNDRNNRMVYVVALEEDGYGRDVTPRYAKEFGAKTAKIQMSGAKGKKVWWEAIVRMITRPYRLHRDDIEDAELLVRQMTEAMPTSMTGFKSHPIYVLERHLRREEVIHPMVVIGHFRGDPVYARSNVVELKTAENWMRSEGREIKQGEQPMKMVKVRAVTTARKRAIEVARMEGGADADDAQQGLYAEWQTQPYVPPPVVDGVVPKNDFGNIDLYTPSMLPEGAAYVPYKGVAKVARKLGIDHAEAVVGFEFRQRRALPILSGVVVAADQEETLLEAYWEITQADEEKQRQKKWDRMIKNWQKLVNGLRIRERLMKEYSVNAPNQSVPEVDAPNGDPFNEGGGFLLNKTDVDVVTKYSLPRMQHLIVNPAANLRAKQSVVDELEIEGEDEDDEIPQQTTTTPDSDDDDSFGEQVVLQHSRPGGMLKSMAQLADEAEEDSTSELEGVRLVEEAKTLAAKPRMRSRTAPQTRNVSRPATVAGAKGRTRLTATTQSSPLPSDGSIARKRTRRVASGRSRRRKALSSEDEEDEESDEVSGGSSDSSVQENLPKRARRSNGSSAMQVDESPATGRTLRPRRGKTQEQKQRDREMERAYRDAITDD